MSKIVKNIYKSPIGNIVIFATAEALTGLFFENQKNFPISVDNIVSYGDNDIINRVKKWLDSYFMGKYYPIDFPIQPVGTIFQLSVWQELLKIPYGETSTYKIIAQNINCKSAEAVGGAIKRNNISIIIPCHRVIKSDGTLSGYAGGTDRKQFLLALEQKKYFN